MIKVCDKNGKEGKYLASSNFLGQVLQKVTYYFRKDPPRTYKRERSAHCQGADFGS